MQAYSMILVILITLPGFIGQAVQPRLDVDYPPRETVALDREVVFTASVVLPPGYSDVRAELKAPALENLVALEVSQGVVQTHGPGKQATTRWFKVRLRPLEPGPAGVGRLEVELSDAGGVATTLRAPGFRLTVVAPLQLWPIAGWVFVLAAAVALPAAASAILLRKRRSRRGGPLDTGPEMKRIDEIESTMRRGEFRKAAEAAFVIIADELGGKPAAGGQPSRTAEHAAAAYRLGEEIRYAGYEPNKRETAFLVNSARDLIVNRIESHPNNEGKET